MFVITLRPVRPGYEHRSRRDLGNDLRVFGEDIRPDHCVPAVPVDEARNVLELLQVHLAGSQAFRLRLGEPFELPGLIHAHVNERAGEQARQLVQPVREQVSNRRLERIELAAVRHRRQVRVALDAEQVVQVPVKLKTRDHVDVPFAPVSDDRSHLVFGKATLGIQQGKPVEGDARLVIEVVLVGLPARQKVELALDLLLRGQRTVAHVHHDSAISQRRPVVDIHLGQRRLGGAPFDQLIERLDPVEQASGRLGANLAARGRHF